MQPAKCFSFATIGVGFHLTGRGGVYSLMIRAASSRPTKPAGFAHCPCGGSVRNRASVLARFGPYMRVRVVEGNLLDQQVEVIVNAWTPNDRITTDEVVVVTHAARFDLSSMPIPTSA